MDAKTTTAYLGGTWHGGYGTAPCPVCQFSSRKDQDALTLTDGYDRLLLNCKKSNCSFADILAAAGINSGDYQAPDPAIAAQRKAEQGRKVQKRAEIALATWNESTAIHSTLAETYLRNRGITCALPDSLRYFGDCWHSSAQRIPAMIGLVSPLEGDSLTSIHRTYLAADGQGKADITPNKAMLGATSGGCVRLSHGDGALIACEGLETGLSLLSGLFTGPATVVAALSTSGIRGLVLPAHPARLIIASDGDEAGCEAGKALAERAHLLGWDVSLMPAPDGKDFNDVLVSGGVR